jgi:hypothetical protein
MLMLLVCSTGLAQKSAPVSLHAGPLEMHLEFHHFRYGFSSEGKEIVGVDSSSGITLNGSPVEAAEPTACGGDTCELQLRSETGATASLRITLTPNHATLELAPQAQGEEARFQTAGAAPAYGLADHAVLHQPFDTDVSGFHDDQFLSGQGLTRLVSNFLIYPRQRFAEVLVDPFMKIVHTSPQQIVEGAVHLRGTIQMHYLFGSMHDIYREYLGVRNASGYRVDAPKYSMFGVGWEAFGALGWNTNQTTVRENVDHYLALGYPLRWIVIGSGYWPADKPSHETTAFGMFDPAKYPDPKALFAHFHEEHLQVLLGLRICFVTNGPFADEGVRHGYFLMREDKPAVFRGSWPESPYYLLDSHNPQALSWYIDLTNRWKAFGVDGYKEDFYGFGGNDLRDDKVDPTNNHLMDLGQNIIERNGYLSSNGDLHRIDDFNYPQNQDRGPVNALALAYAGFPLVYPDIVGGTFGENRFSPARTPQMETYIMRNAQWASVHSSMGMGEPPWTFSSPRVGQVMLQAAQLHGRLQPYFYTQGVRFSLDGYPWTMTPLPIAYPDDPNVYGRGNANVRGYEWQIGDALLATPLYGNDYATATTRDVYLPRGIWTDYDTGKQFVGPLILHDFPIPTNKTPLFVGGSGIVIEDVGNQIVARAYPVTKSSKTVCFFSGSQEPDKITIEVKNWKNVKAIDETSGKPVAGKWVRHAFQIEIEAGHDYLFR